MTEVNNEYWLHRDGRKYQDQQVQRTGAGVAIYGQQEQWLTQFLHDRAKKLGRPVRVLEFGCGFGRFAHLFAANPDVVYSGYDFSQSMVQPLYDALPEGLPVERIRVAATLGEAFPEERFDCVFTVSVLIHNSPSNAQRLVRDLLSRLEPDGQLCLMENQLASFSMRENNWHGGCWVHDHISPFADECAISVYRHVVDHQDIYVFRAATGSDAQITLHREGMEPEVVDRATIRMMGLDRIESAARGLEGEVENFAAQQAEAHDAREDMNKLRLELANKEQALVQVTARLEAGETLRTSFEDVLQLRKKIDMALLGHDPTEDVMSVKEAERKDEEHLFAPTDHAVREAFQWDALRDTSFAFHDADFDTVCHVFHQEWFGIRAAAGALPGHKLAIAESVRLSASSINHINALLREHRIARLVVHGFSANMAAFVRAMRACGHDYIYLVWHGAPAMWVFEGERQLAQGALDLVRRGTVRGMQGMRRGMDSIIGSRAFQPQLLNIAPTLQAMPKKEFRRGSSAIVLSPSWNLLHKNLVTNLLAAQINPRVAQFWTMARDLSLNNRLSSKLKVLSPRSGRDMLETMRQADLISNVSIVDCHPMVDQEALAVGTPCLRGPLFLDALEDHPYVRLTEVTNPLSVDDISAGIMRVLDVEATELSEMMADYSSGIREISLKRYLQFVELK